MSKYYEVVPITEKPEEEGWYYVLNPNGEILPIMIEYKLGIFYNNNKALASYYLKPLSDLPLSREQAEKVWNAAEDFCYDKHNPGGWLPKNAPDKETYLKQFS
jgi:hypothetical protein